MQRSAPWIGTACAVAALIAPTAAQAPAPPAKKAPLAVSHAPASPAQSDGAPRTDIVRQYCAGCHSDKAKAGQLSLASYDATKAEQNAEVTERMIRKLRAGVVPPPGAGRPGPAALAAFVASLENTVDAAAALHPNPGRRAFQRLSRAEYARSVRELLAVAVDVNAFLPPDTISFGFDNMS